MLNNYTLITSHNHKTNRDCSTFVHYEKFVDYKSRSTEDVFPCKGLVFLDRFNTENKLSNFSYFLSSGALYNGSLGLAYVFQNKQLSIVHKLKSE